MFCYNCGANIPDGSQFCVACGAPSAAQLVQQKPIAARPRKKRSFSAGTGFFGFITLFIILALIVILLFPLMSHNLNDSEIVNVTGNSYENSLSRVAWALLPISVLAVYAGIRYFSMNVRVLLSVGLGIFALYLLVFAIKDIQFFYDIIDEYNFEDEMKTSAIISFLPQYIILSLPGVLLAVYLFVKSIRGAQQTHGVSTAIMCCFSFQVARVLIPIFSKISVLCQLSIDRPYYIGMDREYVLTVAVYPLIASIIQMLLVVFFFVSLDMLVPEGIKIKKNEAEESAK